MSERHSCKLAEGFSAGEKIFAQVTFHAFWITGFMAIWQDSALWALAYMVIVAYGILGLLMRHVVCPRCPHLYKYGDCLQAPVKLSKWLVKTPTSAPMSGSQKVLGACVLTSVSLFPFFWLWDKPYYLAVFCVLCGAWWMGQFLHFCRQCRVQSCPFNQAGAGA